MVDFKFECLSVIVPVYNEEKTVLELLNRLKQVPLKMEILVVDDGSSDGSWAVLEKLPKDQFRVFRHESNRGKGAAIRTALNYATGNVVVIQDADLELNPQEFLLLLEPIKAGQTQVVFGSRELKSGNIKSLSSVFYWGGKITTWTANLLYGIRITDEPTCYKMMHTELLKSLHLEAEHFEFCPEVTAKIAKRGLKIVEVPISYTPRSKHEGKKIRWKDGIQAIYTLCKYRVMD